MPCADFATPLPILFSRGKATGWSQPALEQDWTVQRFADRGFDVSADATGYRMARDALGALELSHRVVARLEHFTFLPEAVRNTDHAALFHHSVWQRMSARQGLVMREIPVPVPTYAIRTWFHRQFADDPALVWPRDALARCLDTVRE